MFEDAGNRLDSVLNLCDEYGFSKQFCNLLYQKASSSVAKQLEKYHLNEQRKTNNSYLVFQQTALAKSNAQKVKQYPLDVTLPDYILKEQQLRLNIGGYCYKQGWLVVNVQVDSFNHCIGSVDIFREMHNLSGIPDNAVHSIYASHILGRE